MAGWLGGWVGGWVGRVQDPGRDFNTSPDSVALGFVAVSFPRASSEGFSFSTGITAGQKLHFPEARDRNPRKSTEIIRRLISCSSSISGAFLEPPTFRAIFKIWPRGSDGGFESALTSVVAFVQICPNGSEGEMVWVLKCSK